MTGILTDTTRCVGCNEYVAACKKTYGHEPDVPRRWQKTDGLSARNWTSVIRRPGRHYVSQEEGEGAWQASPRRMHHLP